MRTQTRLLVLCVAISMIGCEPAIPPDLNDDDDQAILGAVTLEATASSTQVDLTWTTNRSSVRSFVIKRGTSSSALQTLTTLSSGSTYADTGITAGATYFYRVIANTSNGLRYGSPTVPVLVPGAATCGDGVCDDAETCTSCAADCGACNLGLSFSAASGAITPPFTLAGGVVSQNNTTVTVDATSGSAEYTFDISVAGDYTLSAEVNAPNEGANSFFINIDAQPTSPTMIWDIPVTSGFESRAAAWRGNGTPEADEFAPKVFALSAGVHKLILRGREAGTQVRSFALAQVGGAVDMGSGGAVDMGSGGAVDMGGSGATGQSFYVRAGGAGARTGLDWNNAWDLGSIAWGSVKPGDTIWVAAGTYSQALTVGASGTATSRITIRAAQDTYVGVANFAQPISFGSKSYVTLDGRLGASRNFATSSTINGSSTMDPGLHGFTITNAVLVFTYAGRGEISYNVIDESGAPGIDAALVMVGSSNSRAYGQTKIHHNSLTIRGQINNGFGPDGFQVAHGSDLYSNTFRTVFAGTFSNTQHQDMLQLFGDEYVRIYGNDFIDSGDSMIDFSDIGTGVTQAHLYVYNNVFRRTVDGMGTLAIRMYSAPGSVNLFDDIHIDNNTFVDGARTTSSFGAAIRIQGNSATVTTNSSIRNNIFFNMGDGWPIIVPEGNVSGWTMSNNLVNAGSEGNTSLGGMVNVNGQSGAPVFVRYTPYALDNDFHLLSSSTAAIDKGVSLSSFFSTDSDGTARPQSGAWDIGAFEYH